MSQRIRRTSFLFASALALPLALISACSDDTTGGGETGGFMDENAPTFDGVAMVEPIVDSKLRVSWNPATDDISSPDEIRYRVYTSTTPGGQDFAAPAFETEMGITSVDLDGLTADETYYVVVRAVDEADNEDANVRERVGTVGNLTAPEFDGAVSATPESPTSVRLTWNPGSDAETPIADLTYAIYVAGTSDGHDFLADPLALSAPGATEILLEGLTDYTEYWFVVRARDSGGREDGNQKAIVALTPDGTAPEFNGVSEVFSAGNGATLTWTAAHDNASNGADIRYHIFASTSATGHDFTSPDVTTMPGVFGAQISGLDLSTEYFFVVRAEDEAGNVSQNTNALSATTGSQADETPPEFNGLLLAATVDAQSIRLTWDPASDDTTPDDQIVYDAWLARDTGEQDFSAAPTATSSPGQTTMVVGNLEPETNYYAIVRARDVSGNRDSNATEWSALTDVDDILPDFGGVTSLVATGPQTIEASWQPASDIGTYAAELRYQIFVRVDPDDYDLVNPTAVTDPGRTSHVIDGLEPDTEYFVMVRALDPRDNASTNTNEDSELTWPDTIAPTWPSGPVVSTSGLTSLFVDWEDVSDDVDTPDQIQYQLFTGPSADTIDFGNVAATSAVGVTQADLTGLIPGDEYFVAVRALDRAGNFTDSGVDSGTTTPDTVAAAFDGAFQVIGSTSTTVTLQWEEAVDNYSQHANIDYVICRSQTPTGCIANFVATATVTGQTQYTDTGLTIQNTYYYVVRSRDEFNNMDSNSRIVYGTTVPDDVPPTWDQGTSSISATTVNEGTVSLTWSAASDEVTASNQIAFDIYTAESPSAVTFSTPVKTVIGQTSTTVEYVDPATTHLFVVRARDLAGNSTTNTDQDSATTPSDTNPPSSGGDVGTVTATTCKSMSISWSAATDLGTPPNEMRYDVCVGSFSQCGSTNFSNVVKTVTGSTSTTYSVSSSGTYYVKVRPKDNNNNVRTTNVNTTVALSNLDNGSPTTPASLTRNTFASSNATRVQLVWPLSTDSCYAQNTIRYEICRGTSSTSCNSTNFAANKVATSSANASSYNLYQNSNTLYYFGVRALDNSNNVSTPRTGSVTTPVSWSTNLAASVKGPCAGCHGGSPSGGDGWDYAELVNNDSNGFAGVCDAADPDYVIPGNASGSLLYSKLASSSPYCGVRMPQGCSGASCWSSSQLTTLYNWIQQGAYNN